MNNKILALTILVMMLFAVGCGSSNDGSGDGGYITEDGNVVYGNGVEEKNADGEFFYRGKVTSIDNKNYIAMEIVDSEVAFGVYHALISDGTLFLNSEGESISRSDVKVGDTIEVVFSGQVMMSLPAQIYAQKVILK